MRTVTESVKTLLQSSVRQFRYRVDLWDLLSSGAPTLAAIVAGTATATTHAAFYRDVTASVEDGLTWEEPGDKRAARVSFSLVDYTNRFDPDAGTDAKFMQIGQLVQVLEGDLTLATADWVTTFTGHIRGQVGFVQNRETLKYDAQLVAYSRRATPRYLKQSFISQTYGAGTDYGTICSDVAAREMSLSATEFARFPASLGKVTQFKSNSIVEMTPLEAIDKLLETVGQVSDFDGAGVLRSYSRDIRRAPDKTYQTLDLIFSLIAQQAEIEAYNSVSVTGLDKNITEVEQLHQTLGRATIPVGFWRPTHTVKVPWSRDLSVRAKDTILVILTSVNDSLFAPLGDESYQQLSDFEGQISVDMTQFVATMVIMIIVTLAAYAALPDSAAPIPVQVAPATGTGATVPPGFTFPIGKIIEAALLAELFLLFGTTSSGVYEIQGTALIPVFKEISSVVTQSGLPDYLIHQKVIRNDFINTMEELLELAKLELLWEVAQASPREFEILNDLELEVGDIVQLPIYGGTKFWIQSLSKTFAREQIPILRVSCIKLPQGV